VLSLPGLRLGALRNAGVAASRGDVVAFVDADHEIVPGWIAAAAAALAPPAVAAGDACRPPTPGTRVQRLYDRLRRHAEARQTVEWLGSGNMAVTRAAFDAAGGFDESLETCEDVDLCRKLRARGGTIVADPRLGNVHYGDPRTLGHVFRGELWRGRDNVRVSLRPPLAWRTVVSAVVPMVNLAAIAAVPAGLLTFTATGAAIAAGAALVPVGLIAARASRMTAGAGDWPAACSVAAAYELGRAFALAGRSAYRVRRKAATADA
jgi:hypothetical protein